MQFKSGEVVSLAYHKGIYTKFSPSVLRAMGGSLKGSHVFQGGSSLDIWGFQDGSGMAVGDEFATAFEPIDVEAKTQA